MKFKSENDKILFEALNLDEKVIRKKLQIVRKAIDRKKSRTMKDQWRRNKHKYLKGIRKWHKSTQGKRFHRALGRFNALREDIEKQGDVIQIGFDEITEALFALSSIETHLYLELQYYENDIEALSEFLEIVENFFEEEAKLKQILLNSYITGVILKEYLLELMEIFSFFIDPIIYYYEERRKHGLSNDVNELKGKEKEVFLKHIKILKDSYHKDNLMDLLNNLKEEFLAVKGTDNDDSRKSETINRNNIG